MSSNSSTTTFQRVFIWVIAIVMTVGTLGAYFAFILADKNQKTEQEQQQEMINKLVKEQQMASQPLPGYEAYKFDPATVTTLQKTDLKEGTGTEVTKGAKVKVNYHGNLPDGTIFDSSNKSGTVTPVEFELVDGALIAGWIEGIPGTKEGGVRRLVIPSAQAYGEQGNLPTIPPNTPLAFVVEVVDVAQ